MLDVFLVILHALCMVLVFLKDLCFVKVEATFTELPVTLLYVGVRSEEHQNSSLNAFVQLKEEATKVTE